MRPGTVLDSFMRATGVQPVLDVLNDPVKMARMSPNQQAIAYLIRDTGQEDAFGVFEAGLVKLFDKNGNRATSEPSVKKYTRLMQTDMFRSMSTSPMLFGGLPNPGEPWRQREGSHRDEGFRRLPTGTLVIIPVIVGVTREALLTDPGIQVQPHMAVYRWVNDGGGVNIGKYTGIGSRWNQHTSKMLTSLVKCVCRPFVGNRGSASDPFAITELAALLDDWATDLWSVFDSFAGLSKHCNGKAIYKKSCHMAPFVIALKAGMNRTDVMHALTVFTKDSTFGASPVAHAAFDDAVKELARIPQQAGSGRDKPERAAGMILLSALDCVRKGVHTKIPPAYANGEITDAKAVFAQWPMQGLSVTAVANMRW